MSWTTGTQTEALAASTVIPSAYNTFTSVQYIGTPTAAGYLPANFFLPSYGSGKSVLVRRDGTGRGRVGRGGAGRGPRVQQGDR